MQALLLVVLGEGVPLALARHHVHDDGPVVRRGLTQHVLHLADVVAVDGADVADAERLEEVARLQDFAEGGA